MVWTSIGDPILLSTEWQYTEPITSGEFFRLNHQNPSYGALFAIAQVEINNNELHILDSQVLQVEKGISDVIKFPLPGCFTNRRLAIKRLLKQPTLEQEVRRLFLPGYLQSEDDQIRIINRSEWQVAIEVSDYAEPEISLDLTPIETKLDEINSKIDDLQSSGSSGSGSTTQQAITSSFFNEVKALNPHLYWRLGESSGTSVVDSSNNNRNGTYSGNITYGVASSLSKDSNTAITCPDGSGRISIGNQTLSSPISALVRFKTNSVSNLGLISFADNIVSGTASWNYIVSINAGKISFYCFDGGSKTIESPNAYNDGNWHTLVVTAINQGNMKLFVDGTLVASRGMGGLQVFNGFWTLGFSKYGSSTILGFIGSLDEFAIFNSELQADKITTLHTAAIS